MKDLHPKQVSRTEQPLLGDGFFLNYTSEQVAAAKDIEI